MSPSFARRFRRPPDLRTARDAPTAMMFDALEPPVRLPARVADVLKREIGEGRLKPGDRLPTEKYLAQNFGVSRNVVREAIAQLRSAGLVASKQGMGTVVAGSGAERSFRLGLDGTANPSLFLHVYEMRLGVEMEAAALAALRATPAQLDHVSRTFEWLQEARRWESEGVALDISFHLAVAQASGNPLFVESIEQLTERMRETIAVTRERSGAAIGEVKRLTIDEHGAIRDAILARDPEAARRAVANHLTGAAHRLGYEMTAAPARPDATTGTKKRSIKLHKGEGR